MRQKLVMIIENLEIRGFRNLIHCELSFCNSRNLIHGMNGTGKTSVLEAIFLLSFGKSFLNRKKTEMVNIGSDEFIIRSTSTNPRGLHRVAANYKNRLSLYLDQKKSNIFEINNYLYPVFFSSSDYNLSIENKPHTRKMIDRFIFGVNSLYIRCILGYNKALKQKNYLLKTSRNLPELRSWNKIISELTEKIVRIKMKFLERLNIEIKNKFDTPLTIGCRPSLKIDEGISREIFFRQLETLVQPELKYQRSMAGPHLDAFDIHLNSKPLKIYSSGEKKIHLLMIYISFIELYKKIKKEYPVFLVDDFDTAIDDKNIAFLMENYPEMQVIATSVHKNSQFDKSIQLKKTKEN